MPSLFRAELSQRGHYHLLERLLSGGPSQIALSALWFPLVIFDKHITYLYIPNNKDRLFIQNQKRREARCLPVCIWWKWTAIRLRMAQAGQLPGCPCAPGAGLCSPFSHSLPLQHLQLARCVGKLIQLSEGLFLAPRALHLTAAQKALLSCCPESCWFGETGAFPWLCPCSHPLSQSAHRLPSLNPGPRPAPASPTRIFLSRFLWMAIGEHAVAVTGPWPACRQQLSQARAVRRSNGCPCKETRVGGNYTPQSSCTKPGWRSESRCKAEDGQMQQLAR